MELSIVLPAYNEGSGIRNVVEGVARELKKTTISFEIIVVDNGSTDNTASVLNEIKSHRSELVVVSVFPNQGFGNGILAGLAQARGNILGWMPGDGQLSAPDMLKTYLQLKDERLDVAKGIRVVRDDNPFRVLQSVIYNFLFRVLFKVPYSDINAPPKLFTRKVYENVTLSSKDWFLDAELILKAHNQGFTVGESRLSGQLREWGTSKVVKVLTVCEFIKNMLKYKLRHVANKKHSA